MQKITYSKRIKLNLGNYESTDIEITAERYVSIEEGPDDAYKELRTSVNKWLKEEVNKIKGK
jgi:hypothetical protein